ncbi:MAG: NAD-dependent epimerase/dehydratase family protein, partial [Frankiaceae bacterium]|nr:NAD-dependent epimerase/dehydratase family protein [Frankiaceae bacterium]
PLAPYGAAKLGLERAAAEWAGADGAAVLIGRISNLYGPGQNLGKAQGLISQICRAHLLREPISIWAPLDSARDYLYAPDCARMIAEGLDLLAGERRAGAAGVRTKIFASGQGATVGFLIAELRRIVKHPPRVVFASSVATRFQPRDLRLRSVVWPQIDRLARTPLPVGIKRVAQDLLAALQAARLR